MAGCPRVLLIDSYDSFTHNLAALCQRAIPDCTVHIIRNDQLSLEQVISVLPYFSAIIVGPGPGTPDRDEDVGILKHLWKISDDHLIPIFGVCLGLQSLALAFNAEVRRLDVVKHGQISRIYHDDSELYEGVGDVHAVRYHSLHVDLTHSHHLERLAWADDGEENGVVVMAIKHQTKPFWAVQYHPESVRTSGGGEDVLRNFWRSAQSWTSAHRQVLPWDVKLDTLVGNPWPNLLSSSPPQVSTTVTVKTHVIKELCLSVTDICEALGVDSDSTDFVLLDSAAQPGRFSIIGCLDDLSMRINYHLEEPDTIKVTQCGRVTSMPLAPHDIWTWLADFMRTRRASGGDEHLPFWGGLIGYLSYEVGVANLNSTFPPRAHDSSFPQHPDVNMVYVDRTIVVDSFTGQVYLQTLRVDDDAWFTTIKGVLKSHSHSYGRQPEPIKPRSRAKAASSDMTVQLPDRATYISRIRQAKEYLYSGDSYELCLTAPSRISLKSTKLTSWDLYKTLRKRNPAPHAAYLRLGASTLVSSSPERFLSYSRPPGVVCQLRPIKGTVRKGPGVTRAVAEQALVGSPKEVAENLMIVDLIRHDLHGVVGNDVTVKQFCSVEEYHTVWQLVSVIEGRADAAHDHHELGWEALRRSLPPGSMTGAPKKRSVEILHTLEVEPRGIYSGVFGYWCVSGAGDWSVTIRTCFKHDPHREQGCATGNQRQGHNDAGSGVNDEWMLGAGGAITALSDPEAEWEEMIVKVESVLQAFEEAHSQHV
ncbi:hypothetical protein QCA50_002156 [Cerrena zonata]|uniref:aminodeoxychorismate synthase n=1 Tax=Cerrena zonata TaxID=2478898 RepID=A0AAW0GWF3_9APHY